jgi:very-short-patch-repair endonuclease
VSAFTAQLAHWLRDHHGITSVADLDRLGASRAQRRRLVDSGVLEAVHEGVYRVATAAPSFESQCAALCAADPSLVISCTSAGRLWRLRRCAAETDIHVMTARCTKPVLHGARVHRTTALPDADVVWRPDGIRLTSPPRTAFDLARHLGDLDLESVIEQLLERQHCVVPTLYAVGRRLCRRGRPGSERFARVVSSRPAWRRPADSHPEVALRAALERAGLRGLVTQPAVTLPNGARIHPDLGIPDAGFYIEIDDAAWHAGRLDAAYDKRRDRLLRATGATVERVDTEDIRRRLDVTVAELLATHLAWIGDGRRSDLRR